MHAQAKMRDRRNTNLSTSSTFSSDSALSAASRPSLNEKRLSTPPPTPSILDDEPFTKENYSRPVAHARCSMAVRVLVVLCGLIAIWRLFCGDSFDALEAFFLNHDTFRSQQGWLSEIVPHDDPTAIKLSDLHDNPKWTVRIPHNYSFPLQTKHIRNICQRGETLREQFSQQSRVMAVNDWRRKGGYYSKDNTFLDIAEAESAGVIPASEPEANGPVCDRSLTFAFDLEDDSFGKSLLLLWLSYGLAKREGRAFFVDDTRWLYGQYTSFFAPPPQQSNCVPPPRHHVVPCPHSARHLLVSSSTVAWTFGAAFEREYLQTWKTGVARSAQIYDLVATGFRDLFHLTGEHALYAASRVAKYREDAHQHGSAVIGIHLRRGDLHPFEFQFSQDYLPLERYGAAARRLLGASHLDGPATSTTPAVDLNVNTDEDSEADHCPIFLGTDDPATFDSPELQHSAAPYTIHPAQERIRLATKATLDGSLPSAADAAHPAGSVSVYTKHVDENSGWEGGFYSALFSALGRASPGRAGSRASSALSGEDLFSEQAVHMRELVGRAYVLDLAVLGQSDGIVCASSSATCRLLAVMLGWEAVNKGSWVNVDDGRAWSWDGRR